MENYYTNLAQLQKKDVILLYDRGVCDNFAYCTEKVKENVLKETGWTWNYICNDRYDMVIHLVTAARGAEKHYGSESNPSRYENLEEAKLLDEKTVQ